MINEPPFAAGLLRQLFEQLVELDASGRRQKLEQWPLSRADGDRLLAMLAFDDLEAVPPAEREAHRRSLDLDPAVRSLLDAMLRTDHSFPALLRGMASRAVERIDSELRHDLPHTLLGTRVGDFRLVEQLGEGGSSVVFRADRAVGEGTQSVALKLLRTGLFSAEAQRRFRREQAILAQLVHANIAHLIEGGVSAAGIPYIAMELVQGEPITRAADGRGLGLRERLEWFVHLCRAIEAAHAALIVHRDIKPSNILITADGRLKVLDFGIARLLDDEEESTRTVTLTPEYAAPEQYSAGVLTTAVDVYALGVLLGELLTGQRVRRDTRASDHAAVSADDHVLAVRGMRDLSMLVRRLRGDLDAIIAKASAVSACERYATAAALAEDIERHLDGAPVKAHPLSRRYLFGKFVRRHRTGLCIASAVAAAIVLAFGLFAWQFRIAREQTARAESARDFLVSVFNAAGAELPIDKRPSTTDIVAQATRRLAEPHAVSQGVRQDLLLTLAEVARSIGSYDKSLELLDLAQADPHVDDAQAELTQRAVVLRATVFDGMARWNDVVALLEPRREEFRENRSPVAVDGLRVLGRALMHVGRGDEGLALLKEVVSLTTQDATRAPERLLVAAIDEATATIDAQRFHEGLALSDRALELWRQAGSPQSRAIVDLFATTALAAEGAGDIPRAEKAYKDAIDFGNRFFEKTNASTAWNVGMYGSFLCAQGRFDAAEPFLRQGLAMRREVFGDSDARTLNAVAGLGKLAAGRHDFVLAEQWYTSVIDLCEKASIQDIVCPRSLAFRARARARQGRYDDANVDIRQALRMQSAIDGENTPGYAFILDNMLAVQIAQKRFDEALQTADRILAMNRSSRGGMLQTDLTAQYQRARALAELGRNEEALHQILQTEPAYARLAPRGVSRFDMLALSARLLAKAGRNAQAREAATRALAIPDARTRTPAPVIAEMESYARE